MTIAHQDQLLKQTVQSRETTFTTMQRLHDEEHWLGTISDEPLLGKITVFFEEEIPLTQRFVANLMLHALEDLSAARGQDLNGVLNEENCALLAELSATTCEALSKDRAEDTLIRLSQKDLHLFIEKILIENLQFDLAKALAFRAAVQSQQSNVDDAVPSQQLPVRLIRRNGRVVPWNEKKIEEAVRQAFLSLQLDPAPAAAVASGVTGRVFSSDRAFHHIEDIQDIVQEELMRQGHYKVVEHYILYRNQRREIREQQLPVAAEQVPTSVVLLQEDGSREAWEGLELKKRIAFSSIGLSLSLNSEEIQRELLRSVSGEISPADLKKTIILNTKTLVERDADFHRFGGRVLLTYIYEEVLGWSIQNDGIEKLREMHREAFEKYLRYGVEIKRLNPELLERYDLKKLADALDPTADLDFDLLGFQTLYDRYLLVDKTQGKPRRIEVPQFFWMRVAMGLFKEEPEQREDWAIRLYQLYKGRRFCSSTPTLFNSGTLHSQLSSCYLYKVDDSIESIMQRGIAENAYLSKWAGGLGGSWTAVRGTGGYIQGTNGESQGIIPFLKLHNDQLVAVNQGGKRNGSGCAYLETWHNDIIDFLELRKNTGDERRRCHDMNTANWVPDLFMQRMESRENWTLFRANETPDLHDLYGKAFAVRYEEYEAQAAEGKIWSRQIPAIELWKQMLRALFETGHPWITFKDPCNVRSPQDHVGVIHSSNLCTEITLNTSAEETAVCNLGSVVLDSHMNEDGTLDLAKLQETILVAIRALDNVIDINFYPTEAAKTANSRHRPIGMGVMGLQNALHIRDVPFASQEAVEFNDEFMEAIAYFAYDASAQLAAERGVYSSYKGSKWDRGILPQDTIDLLESERGQVLDTPRGGKLDWAPVREKIAKFGMRNSNVLAIAPTATISNIMGTTPCIEPNYKNLYVKSNLSGDFTVLNRELVKDLKALGLWNEEMCEDLKYFKGELDAIEGIPEEIKLKHRTVFSIPYEFVIDAAERRQKWIDQSQSVNLFLPQADMKVLSHMYRRAWVKGLKTTYYLRTLQASDIESSTGRVTKELRGVIAGKGEVTAEQQVACSIEAMMNGGTCEACQ